MALEEEPYKRLIIFLSVAIPLLVAVLFGVEVKGYDFSFLPPLYAGINGLTAILLLFGLWAILNRKRVLHERIMKVCLGLSALFLVMYVLYHITSASTPYGGSGLIKYVYYFILITHILLSIVVVPVILFTLGRALAGNFEKHKALARFAFPLWLYVAITGVVIYVMISPYY